MKGAGLQLDSMFRVNCIVWLCGLQEHEKGPTGRMVEDLQTIGRLPVPVQRYDAQTPDELLEAIDALRSVAGTGGRLPALHLDSHGSKEHGLKVGGGFLNWETLGNALRELNVATENNLVVVGGACHALFAIRSLDFHVASPFFALIAPEDEVSSGFLEDRVVPFYEELFKLGLDEAYKKLGLPFKYEHCEKLLAILLVRHIKAGLQGKNLTMRRERLLTEIFQGRGNTNPEALKAARAFLKGGMRPTQDLVDRYASTFLCGKPCSFDIDQLLKLVE